MGNLLQSVKQNPVLWIWNLLSYDNFLVYPMTFFSVTYVHGSHFHIKNVIKSFSSRLSLSGHLLCHFGQLTGVNFQHCDRKQRMVRKRITRVC